MSTSGDPTASLAQPRPSPIAPTKPPLDPIVPAAATKVFDRLKVAPRADGPRYRGGRAPSHGQGPRTNAAPWPHDRGSAIKESPRYRGGRAPFRGRDSRTNGAPCP